MANNGGRQAGGGGNGQMNEHVEFTVKAEEDLYLSGSENTIRRVIAETNYSCLMLKTQRFSSLFRHYAKYHGLRKDDLEYYFVNPLDNEDTPESVQLQRGDTIMVRKRRKPEPPEAAADDEEFYKDMRELLDDDEHMDCVFLVHPDIPANAAGAGNPSATSFYHHHQTSAAASKSGTVKIISTVAAAASGASSSAASSNNDKSNVHVKQESNENDRDSNSNNMDTDENTKKSSSSVDHPMRGNDDDSYGNMTRIRAHKCILTARAEYFKALFRKNNSFRESSESIIRVEPDFGVGHIRYLLEFVYTNRIQSIKDLGTDDLLSLLHLSDRWLLRDLKRLVEHELIRNHMTIQNVARMYGATEDFKSQRLSKACIDFIMENLRQLAGNAAFEEEMKNYPHLCIPVLKAAADLIPEGPVHKKQRTGDHGGHGTGGSSGNPAVSGAHGSSSTPSSNAAGGVSAGIPGVPGGGGGAAAAAGGGAVGGGGAAAAGGGGNAGSLGSSPVPDSDP